VDRIVVLALVPISAASQRFLDSHFMVALQRAASTAVFTMFAHNKKRRKS